MKQPETRHSLITKLQNSSDDEAWSEFVRLYEPFLQRVVERQGVPARHVPDVTQQVFGAIARSVEGWTPDGHPDSFRRWVHRVARNIVIKFMTRERRHPTAQGGSSIVELLHAVADEPDEQLARRYEYELVVWAAGQVRDEFRETSWRAFWGTLIEQRDVQDVAAELGVSPGSIYMSRSRIMARLRQKLAEVSDDD